MFKRLFFALLGLGAGVTLGIAGIRKLEAVQRRLSPEHVAGAAAMRVSGLSERVTAAVEEGRRAASAKEAELRAVYRGGTPRT